MRSGIKLSSEKPKEGRITELERLAKDRVKVTLTVKDVTPPAGRTPNWVTEEIIDNPAEMERQLSLEEAVATLNYSLNSTNVYRHFSWITQPTIQELKDTVKAQGETPVRNDLGYWTQILNGLKGFEKSLREHLSQLSGLPLTFGVNKEWQERETEKINDRIKAQIEAKAPAVTKGIPYVQEIVDVYKKRLNQIEGEKAQQQVKATEVLKNMKKLAEKSEKLFKEAEKAFDVYQKRQNENNLLKLVVIAKEHALLESEFIELQSQINLLTTVEKPQLKDLPALPEAVWKKIGYGD